MMEWTPDKVEALWDYASRDPDNFFAYQQGDKIVSYFANELRGVDRIMDFGCGSGFLIDHLLNAGYRVAGADLSTDSLKQASEKYGVRKGFLGAHHTSESLSRGERWPVIMLIEMIEHLDNDALAEVLACLRQLVTPDGVILITTPNDENLPKNHVFCPETGKVFHRWQHVRSWTVESLTAHLSEHGFSSVRVKTVKIKSKPMDRLRNRIRWMQGSRKADHSPNLTGVFRPCDS